MALENRNRRSLLFVARFAGLLVLFYFLVAWKPINDAVIEPFTAAIARVSGVLLNLVGERVTVAGTQVSGPGFAVNIENGCNGVETVLLFGSAVLAFPSPWRRKVLGFLAGFAAIEALNFVRVMSLFWIGHHHPAWFSSSHTVIWQSIVVLFGVLLFLLWAAPGGPLSAGSRPARSERT